MNKVVQFDSIGNDHVVDSLRNGLLPEFVKGRVLVLNWNGYWVSFREISM